MAPEDEKLVSMKKVVAIVNEDVKLDSMKRVVDSFFIGGTNPNHIFKINETHLEFVSGTYF